MKIAFTICSNNYLSQAKALGDSLIEHNPEYTFFIGLCDKKHDSIDYSLFESYNILEVDNIHLDNFEWMVNNYNIIELNTSIKPFYFQYLFKSYNPEIVIYFDPDIRIYDTLSSLENEVHEKNAILTPHILSPYPPDGCQPDENTILNYGIYNLGFIAIKPTSESFKMLDWWSTKLSLECFDCVAKGLFVDQLPMNLAPLYFDKIQISKNKAFNFAYWNMHERKLTYKNQKYWVNDLSPLVFFHFSSFKPNFPINISEKQTRYQDVKDDLLIKLYSEYAQELIKNNYFELMKIPCYYSEQRQKYLDQLHVEKTYKKESIRFQIKQILRKMLHV